MLVDLVTPPQSLCLEFRDDHAPRKPGEPISAKTEGKDACDSGDKRSLPALRPHALPPKEENGGVALRCPWTLVCTTSLPYPPSQPSG
ncbi:hypothetical protein R6Z07M_009287 [Ovis aries]